MWPGKTTTTERVLFYTGLSHKIGEVHDGAGGYGLDGARARAGASPSPPRRPRAFGAVTTIR